MDTYIKQIGEDLVEKNSGKLWNGFKMTAYALYDQSQVYLFGHPKFKQSEQKPFQIVKLDDQFVGCTLILYKGYPTAIVNMELYNDYESIYAILIHELFHGYQYVKDEKRFPNEMLGITYPLSKQNIELRSEERNALFQAVMTEQPEEKIFL